MNKTVQDVVTRAIGAAVVAGAKYVQVKTGVELAPEAVIGLSVFIYGLAHKLAQAAIERVSGKRFSAGF